MPSVHKHSKSPYWFCAYYLPDGRRTSRSTRETSRRKAMAVCLEYDKASRLARADMLSDARAREVIADIYAIKQSERLPSDTLAAFTKSWLKRKELEVADSSHKEYAKVAEHLLAFAKGKVDRPMDAFTVRDAAAFRDDLSKRIGGATVNKYIKIARVLWRQAYKDGHVRDNVFAKVDPVKVTKSTRRPFTLPELTAVLSKCDKYWRAMVLAGLYTGQRISDISSLTWRQVDFAQGNIHFTTRKTGRHVNMPMAKPLVACLMDLPSSDDPDAPIFPEAYHQTSNTLSRQFSEILMDAELAEKRSHNKKKDGQGRAVRREVDALSFHCLRHTATSLLKNAGVSDVVAREIIGHESEAVSRVYTHIEADTMRDAIDRLPDVTDPKVSARKAARPARTPKGRAEDNMKDKTLRSIARAVEITGHKPTDKSMPANALSKLKRAAAGTTVEQDLAAARARKARRSKAG